MESTKEIQVTIGVKKEEIIAKIMDTLKMYGDTFGAKRMVPVTGKYGHTVLSMGVPMLKTVFDLYKEILDNDVVCAQKLSADPRPIDKNVPASLPQKLVFKLMYGEQERLEKQLEQFGMISPNAYTCTCYLDEVGNKPNRGDILSWAESSAVVYANSVLGARCNRNSGVIEVMGSIAGCVPEFGLLTDDGRKADWIIEVRTAKKPEAQLLGSAVGMKVMEKVPYIKGLDQWLGTKLDDGTCAYLKDFGAATASNGAVGLYHIENLTPEAVDFGHTLIRDNAPVYVIDDAELERVKKSYPCIWKNATAKPKLCFVGCPHLSLSQLTDWTIQIEKGLKAAGKNKVQLPTIFTAAPAVIEQFDKTEYSQRLKNTGVIVSFTCPLMYMNNPLSKSVPVITCSNKLRTYSTARFYSEGEILEQITKGVSFE